MGQRVKGGHPRCPGSPQHLDQQQPDRPAAGHRGGSAEPEVTQAGRVDGHSQGLEHRAVSVGESVRQRMEQVRRPGEVLAHHAVLGAVPGEPDAGAKVRVAAPARPTGAAGDRRVNGHPLATPRSAGHDPGRLVPRHQRPLQDRVPDPALTPPVQVRAADAGRGHPDQAHPRPRHRHHLIG